MNRYFTGSFVLSLALLPSFAFGARYRIDPQPRNAPPPFETMATDPFAMVSAALPSRSEVLTLLNFVVDGEPEHQEGADFPKYNRRQQFGSWKNFNPEENCYNTRAEILIRDSLEPVSFSERNPCLVKNGRWHDPYTGLDHYESSDIQIDHLVPLKNAYVSGAWKWDKKRRCHYGNFMAYNSHLVAVNGRENMRKGDRSPARYMPPNTRAACAYLQQWLNIKAVWNLTLEEDEAEAIRSLMQAHRCTVRFQTVTGAALRFQRTQADQPVAACGE